MIPAHVWVIAEVTKVFVLVIATAMVSVLPDAPNLMDDVSLDAPDSHHHIKGEIKMYFATNQKQSINRVENLGEIITLADRSKWKVSMFDKTKSMMWMMIDDVIVTPYIGNKFKITHVKRNETIEAEFIEK